MKSNENKSYFEDSIIRKLHVMRLTGLSETTIWRLEKENKFPQRRRLSYSACGWVLSEVLEWVKARKNTPMEKRNKK